MHTTRYYFPGTCWASLAAAPLQERGAVLYKADFNRTSESESLETHETAIMLVAGDEEGTPSSGDTL